MNDSAPDRASTDRLMQDLQAVLDDADALLRATAGQAGEKVQQARARAEETMRHARERLQEAQEDITLRAREVAQDADKYVHENPWQAVGLAAGIAFVIGLIVGRR